MAAASLPSATSPLPLRQRLALAAGVPCGSLLAVIVAGGLYAVATSNANEPGLVAFALLWWGAQAALLFGVTAVCCLRAAYLPWRRPATAVAGGFVGLAVGLLVSSVGYWLVSLLAEAG